MRRCPRPIGCGDGDGSEDTAESGELIVRCESGVIEVVAGVVVDGVEELLVLTNEDS